MCNPVKLLNNLEKQEVSHSLYILIYYYYFYKRSLYFAQGKCVYRYVHPCELVTQGLHIGEQE